MGDLAPLVASAMADGNDLLERNIFGTVHPSDIATQIEDVVTTTFGAYVAPLFYRHGVGIAVGFRLERRDVVVKVHHWLASVDRLTAIQRIQLEFLSQGLPVPRPVVGPISLGAGVATVEELILGETADGHDADVRRSLAAAFCRFVSIGRNIKDVSDLEPAVLLRGRADSPWPTPHSPQLNFDATSKGAEWIDHFAQSARRRLEDFVAEPVVGHLDWRVENLGFAGSTLVAIYDWDSVGLAPEAFLVGNTAAVFSSDWSHPNGYLPILGEMHAFVAEYQEARGRSFKKDELAAIDAANLLIVAYGARCQHSRESLSPGSPNGSGGWIELLRERGEFGLLPT